MEKKENQIPTLIWLEGLHLLQWSNEIEVRSDGAELRCLIRNQWLKALPEEWVRQTLVKALSTSLEIGTGRFSIEKQSNRQHRDRYDLVVYSSSGAPWLLIECKSPETPWKEDLSYQMMKYQEDIQAPFILWTNGIQSWIYDVKNHFFLRKLSVLKDQYV